MQCRPFFLVFFLWLFSFQLPKSNECGQKSVVVSSLRLLVILLDETFLEALRGPIVVYPGAHAHIKRIFPLRPIMACSMTHTHVQCFPVGFPGFGSIMAFCRFRLHACDALLGGKAASNSQDNIHHHRYTKPEEYSVVEEPLPELREEDIMVRHRREKKSQEKEEETGQEIKKQLSETAASGSKPQMKENMFIWIFRS